MLKTIEIESCDNPTCDTAVEVTADGTPGFHLAANLFVGPNHERHRFGEVFACSEECLAPAILHVHEQTAKIAPPGRKLRATK